MEKYLKLLKFFKQILIILIVLMTIILLIDYSHGQLILSIICISLFGLFARHTLKSNKPK